MLKKKMYGWYSQLHADHYEHCRVDLHLDCFLNVYETPDKKEVLVTTVSTSNKEPFEKALERWPDYACLGQVTKHIAILK